jgi:hypothetical protein
VLLTHNLPELGTNLVSTLPTLDVQNLTHIDRQEAKITGKKRKKPKKTQSSKMRARKAQRKNLKRGRNRAQALSDKRATEERRRRNRAQTGSEKQEWLRKRAG